MNTACEQARERISAFLDNALSAGEAVALTVHIENCVACRHEYEQTKTLQTAMRGLPSPSGTSAESAKSRVLARFERTLREREAVRPASWWQFPPLSVRPFAATLTAAVVAGIGFLFWSNGTDNSPTPPEAKGQGAYSARTVAAQGTVSIPAPSAAEWDTLFHQHDAQAVIYTVDEPALHRDAAAEAHASLLKQADEYVASNL